MSLIHWWPLSENKNDIVGGAHLSGTYTTSGKGKISNGCASEWGTRLSTSTSNLTGLKNFSIAMWVRLDSASNSNAWSDLFGMNMQKGSTTESLRAEVNTTGGNALQLYCNNISGTSGGAANFTLTKDTWQHLVITKDGARLTSYINGSIVNYTDWSNITDAYCTGEFHLSDGGFYCSYNDVRLYNHVLSTKEIKELSKGLICHYKLDACNNTNIIPNALTFQSSNGVGTIQTETSTGIVYKGHTYNGSGSYNDFCSWSTVSVQPNEVYTASFLARSRNSNSMIVYFYNNNSGVQVSNTKSSQGHNINGGTDGNCTISLTPNWQRIWITWTFNSTATPLVKTLLFRLMNGSGYQADIAEVKLERGSYASPFGIKTSESSNNTIEPDCSGYGHDATKYGTLTYNSDTAINGSCTVFPGTAGNYINCGAGGKVTDAITVNWWGYMDSWTSYGRAISCTEGGGWSFEPSGGKMNFACGTGASSNTYKSVVSTTTLTSLSAGWHMFTGTYDGFKTKIYIDGKLENTNNAYSTKTPLYYANNSIFLGIEAQGGVNNPTSPYFNGRLSDVRIYATALSDAAIQELYTVHWSANKQGQVFSGTINENQSKFQITRGGVNNCSEIIEHPNLPSGYTALDKIWLGPGDRIATYYTPNQNTGIDIEFELTDTANDKIYVFGAGGANYTDRAFELYPYSGDFDCNFGNNSVNIGTLVLNKKIRFIRQQNKVTMYINGVKYTAENTMNNFTCPNILYLGILNRNSTALSKVTFPIYRCVITESGQLIRYYVPCTNSSGQRGMYEFVTKQFTVLSSANSVPLQSTVQTHCSGTIYCNEFNEI